MNSVCSMEYCFRHQDPRHKDEFYQRFRFGTLKEIKGLCQERKSGEFGIRNAEVGRIKDEGPRIKEKGAR